VHAAGVGVWDASIRDGSWRPYGRAKFPLVLGTDGAGRAIAEAKLRVPIAAVYRLEQAAKAHERPEKGSVLGRIVLRIRRGK
jgi:NADPH:quinone reductase-like Zn-dependent oxidoreductase